MTEPYAEYLAPTRADIDRLPEHLARAAKVNDHGEAEWPRSMAEGVVRALVGLGRVVNVVEYARYDGDRLMEQNPVTTYEGTDPEANLRWILSGLVLPDDTAAVVCWHPGEQR